MRASVLSFTTAHNVHELAHGHTRYRSLFLEHPSNIPSILSENWTDVHEDIGALASRKNLEILNEPANLERIEKEVNEFIDAVSYYMILCYIKICMTSL